MSSLITINDPNHVFFLSNPSYKICVNNVLIFRKEYSRVLAEYELT